MYASMHTLVNPKGRQNKSLTDYVIARNRRQLINKALTKLELIVRRKVPRTLCYI